MWTPNRGPQRKAFFSPADEVYYGGSAGGGKTDLAIGLALTGPHKRAIIFRREYPQLADIIRRTQELLAGTGARYNSNDRIWRDIPGGRTLEYGSCPHPGDEERFQGRAHDLKIFDELPHFLEAQYRYLCGWNRSVDPDVRVRIVATGNPPLTPEGHWVIQRWAAWLDPEHPNPAQPGELRWYAMIGDKDMEVEGPTPFDFKGVTIHPKSRTFIPARLSDNPFLRDTDYASTLAALPEPMRSMLLFGDHGLAIDDDPYQVIPTQWVIDAQERWKASPDRPDMNMTALGVDIARGGKDQTVLAKRYGTWYAPLEKHPGRSTPDGQYVAALVIQALEGLPVIPAVDIIGVGASVWDILQMQGIGAAAVNFGAGSDATDRSGRLHFVNLRAEMWWKMREALDPVHGDNLALPPDPELRADLCAPRWKPTTRGIQIEAKEDIKERIGRSPDCGDAVVLANADAALYGAYYGVNVLDGYRG